MAVDRLLLLFLSLLLCDKSCEAAITFTLESTLNSITLTWTPEDGHGYSDFTITLDGTQQGDAHPGSEFDTGSSKTSEVITGLDSGTQYTVAVKNGTDEIWTDTVYTIPAAVSSFNKTSATLNSVTVTWGHGSGSRNMYTISWEGPVNGKVENIAGTDTSEVITGLTAQGSYTFSIVAVSGSKESSSVIVDVTLPDLPRVQNFMVENGGVQVNSVKLTWTALNIPEDIKYTLTSTGPVSSVTLDKNTVMHTFDSLTAGQQYTFTIAVSLAGVTGTQESAMIYTKPTTPSNLETANVGTTTLTLSWNASACQGATQTFTVRDADDTVPTGGNSVQASPASLTDLIPGKSYTFTVTATCGGQTGDKSSEKTESMIPASVTTFTKASSTLNTVTLSWTHGSGERESYTISWGVSEREENIPSTDTSRTITGLKPGQTYTFSIVAVSKNKDSAAVTEVVTLSALPTVNNFAVSSVTEKSVTLSWTAVDTDENIKYELSYESTTATREKDITTHSFSGLSTGTEYTFRIVVVLDGVKGSPETVTDNTEPATPVGVTVGPESTTEVKVGWTANSKYTYTVTYKKKESTGDPITTSCITTGCVIDVSAAKPPGTEITVYVTATLGTRTSDTGTAEGHTVPPAPGQISISSRTTTTLEVTWLDGAAGVFDKYEVSIIDTSTGNAPDGLGTMEIDDEAMKTASLSPLIPGHVYRVDVVTVKGTTQSEQSTGLFRPNPEKATGLKMDSRSTNSLTVKWNQPGEGDFTKYVVSLSGISGSEEKVISGTHTFTDLIGGTQYTASVRVQSGEDGDIATETTAAKTTSEEVILDVYTKPNAPSLNEPSATQDSVTVSWTAPEGDLTGYKLRLYSSDNSPVSEEKTVLKDEEKTLVFDSADNVKSGTIYTVKIFAYIDDSGNDIKSNEMSRQATTVPKAPTGLNTANTDTSSTPVSWTKPTQTADVDGYEVKLDFEGDVKTANVTSTSKDFTGLKAGATYSIEIKAYKVDHNNERSYSPALTGSVTLVPKKPTSVQVLEANKAPTRLGVTWSAPSDSEYSGFIVYWKKEGSADVLESSDEIPVADTYKYDISGLAIGGKYYIEVKTKSGNQRSAAGTTTSTTIPDGTSLNIDSRGTDFIAVSWPEPRDTEFDNFELQISSSDHAGFAPLKEIVQKNSDYRKMYNNLKPGRTYSMSIAVISGNSETRNDLKTKTKPSKVTSLEATTLDMNTIQLRWTVDTNSKQDKFSINYKDANNADKVKLVDYTEGTSSPQAIIENLLPGYHYTFNVLARLEEPDIETVEGESTEVTENTVPAAVTSLQSSKTQTSVTLTWETKADTYQDNFRVRYKGTATSTSWSSPEDVQEKEKMYDGLLPGDKYMFEVWARSGTNDSTKGNITVVLVPNAPTPFWNKDETSTTAVTFTWSYRDNAEYHAERFELELREIGSTEKVQDPVTVAATTSTYTFQGLTAGQTYTVTLTTNTYEDVKSEPKETDGTVEPVIMSDLTEESSTENSVTITYTEDTGVFDRYRFGINDSSSTKKTRTKTEDRQVIFNGLLSGTLYTISAKTESGELESAAKQLQIITKPLAPALNCTEIAPTMLTLRIEPQGEGKNLLDYKFTINCVTNGETCTGGQKQIDFDNRDCDIEQVFCNEKYSGLTASQTYEYTVKSVYTNNKVTSGENTKESGPVQMSCTTDTSPPGPVEDLTVVGYGPYQVNLTWRETLAQNGEVVKHMIEYSAKKAGVVSGLTGSPVSIPKSENYEHSFGTISNPLKAGYNYTFTVYAVNDKGGGTKKSISRLLPIEKPAWNPDIAEENRAPSASKGSLTHNEVEVTFRNVFLEVNGDISYFSIIVSTSKDKEIEENTWASQVDSSSQVWCAIFRCEGFFRKGQLCNIKQRLKRQLSPGQEIDEVSVTIGKSEDCDKKKTGEYCNGPLTPDTEYFFALRAYTENGLITDTPFSEPFRTDKSPFPVLEVVLGIVLTIVALIIIGLLIFMFMYMRRQKKEKDNDPFSTLSIVPSRPINIADFPQHVENMSKDSDYQFAAEYEELKPIGRDQICDNSQLEPNRLKNRFVNILPYDHSRVKLLPSEDEEGSDYINACWMPGYNSKREFICAQGPLPSTVDDFWRMIWEQNVRAIVMLTKCVEKGREKCHHYWPVDREPMFYGDVQVEIISEDKKTEWVISQFQISKGETTRCIPHFHFVAWPDFGVPDDPQGILDFIHLVRDQLNSTKDMGPVLVHCSAGVGRSGTYVVIDRLLQHVRSEKAETIDVFGIVYEMRKYRVFMVQTEQQYIFIHKSLKSVLEGEVSNQGLYNNAYVNDAYDDEMAKNMKV